MDRNLLNRKAIALIEIAVSLVVVSILVYVLLLGGQIVNKIKDVRTDNDLIAVAEACHEYYLNTGHWPSQFSDLQPTFLSKSILDKGFTFKTQTNIMTIIRGNDTVTIVKPRN